MQLLVRNGLPFVTVSVTHLGKQISIENVLIDTGSARTIIAADEVAAIGIVPAPEDALRTMRGLGGSETVFTRKLDRLTVGERSIDGFDVQIGSMDYGFDICGILGLDFLLAAGAVIDLKERTLTFS